MGGAVAGTSILNLALVALVGALLMAWSHTMNTWNDWVLTGFDKGEESDRSHKKPYSAGQNVIAEGVSPTDVYLNGLAWLTGALALTVYLAGEVGPLIWLPVGLTIPMTFAYSYGKKYYLCELVLGLGFGPFAAMLGASVSDNPVLWKAFLVGIPIGIMFGFAAEAYDQWFDADANWDKGLRNIGAWTWRLGRSITAVVALLAAVAYASVLGLRLAGLLSEWAILSAIAFPGLIFMTFAEARSKPAIMAGLGAIFLFCILLAVGEVI